MKGYSSDIPENCAKARLEGVNASYKDLAQVCGRIRNRKTDWALDFLSRAAQGSIPVFYQRHNKRLGHRRELGGRKGRYPEKAAKIVLKVLKSAIANGKVNGLGENYVILAASANKKEIFPRLAPKGRQARSFLETSRVEIVLKGGEVPKGVTVTPPKKEEKKEEPKKAEKKKQKKGKKEPPKPEAKKETPPEKKAEEKEEKQPGLLKEEAKAAHEHKHEAEKAHEHEKARPEKPHQHGEHNKR